MNSSTTSPPGSAVRLYWLLGGVVGVTAALCLLTTLVGIAPILPPDLFSKQIAYGSSVIAMASVIAGVAFKIRVPRRSAVQSTTDYWSMKQMTSAATLTWFVLEGAVMVAGVGYVLTADPISTIVLFAAIAAFSWCNPRQFAKQ